MTIRKKIEKVILGLLLTYVGMQGAIVANDLVHHYCPSVIRQQFKQKLNIELVGWKEDIEGNPSMISLIAQEIDKENLSEEFKVDERIGKIIIEPRSFFKKSLLQQFFHFYFKNHASIIFDNAIILTRYAGICGIGHELKHLRLDHIMKEHPSFVRVWKRQSVDRNNNSLYLEDNSSVLENIVRQVADRRDKFHIFPEIGFVTYYARTNVYEDISELTSLFELSSIYGMLYEKKIFEGQEKVQKKVRLAQHFHLIPKESLEFAKIAEMGDDIFTDKDTSKLSEYLRLSSAFLKKYPASIFSLKVRKLRAKIFHFQGKIDEALAELKIAIKSKWKERISMVQCYNGLVSLYRQKGDFKTSEQYAKVRASFIESWHEGNLRHINNS